jgi:hypothetical protein
MLTPKNVAAGLAVIGFLVFDFVAPAAMEFDPHWIWPPMLLIGVCVGQINLIATWGALGPGNVVVRLPWSILLGLLTWYSLALGFRTWTPMNMRNDEVFLLGAVLLGGLVVAQIPLWIAGKSFRWRLVDLEDPAIQPTGGPLQFSLWHMLLGMVFVALALGLGRLVLPSVEFRGFHLDDELIAILAAMVVTNLVMTVPCIWGALVKSNPVPPLVWPAYCGVVTAVEFGVLCGVLGSPGPDAGEVFVAFFLLNLSQCATVYFVLRIFRAVGFLLVQALRGELLGGRGPPGSSPPAVG